LVAYEMNNTMSLGLSALSEEDFILIKIPYCLFLMISNFSCATSLSLDLGE